MKQHILNGKLRYIGYPESLCRSCIHNSEPCSFGNTRDMQLCPDYDDGDGKQKRLLV